MFETLLFVNGVVLVCFKRLALAIPLELRGLGMFWFTFFETPTALPFEDEQLRLLPRTRGEASYSVAFFGLGSHLTDQVTINFRWDVVRKPTAAVDEVLYAS